MTQTTPQEPDALQTIAAARAAGIALRVQDDQIKLRGPKAAVARFAPALKAVKPAAMALLAYEAAGDSAMPPITDPDAWVTELDLAPETAAAGDAGGLESAAVFKRPLDQVEATMRRWYSGLAQMEIGQRGALIPRDRWAVLLRVSRALMASAWARRFADLGWRDTDLFGCNSTAPVERIDGYGIVWLLAGSRIGVVTANTATIITASGAKQTYCRMHNRVTDMVSLWELTTGVSPRQSTAEASQ